MASRTTPHAKRRQSLIVGLLFLLILLGAGIGYLKYDDQLTQPGAEIHTAQYTHLQIDRPQFPAIKITRAADAWQIIAPIEIAANAQRLEPLLQLPTHGGTSYPLNEVNLDELGLTSPVAVVSFDDVVIAIGDEDVSGERRYILEGNTVRLVPQWMLSLINGGLSALADLTLLPDALAKLGAELDDTPLRLLNASAWQSLSAQQLVLWPLSPEQTENDKPKHRGRLIGMLKTDAVVAFDVWQANKFVAFVPADKTFAYIVATHDLPEPL